VNQWSTIPKKGCTKPQAAGQNWRLSYWQHAEALTGTTVSDEAFAKSRFQEFELDQQSEEIAAKLRAMDIPTYRPENGHLAMVGVCTGKFSIIKEWRHINFLPAVASANRRQLVKRLSYFAESRPYLRYLVFTNGPRCSSEQLRDRLKDLARSISRYSACPELKKMGVFVELRVSELTAERGPDGSMTYHPHANVIINCTRKIDWQRFLELTRQLAPGHWQDNGRLFDADEAIKYFVKPSEVLDHNHRELLELFTATFGLHLAQPMNAFRAFTQSLKVDRLKLAKRLDKDKVWRWCFVKMMEAAPKLKVKRRADDRVVALIGPQPRFSPTFEPCLLVYGFTGDIDRVLRENRLGEKFAACRARFMAAKAAPSIRFTPPPQLSEISASENEAQHRKRQPRASREYLLET